jgi:hypothetical protein
MAEADHTEHYFTVRGRGFDQKSWRTILSVVRQIVDDARENGVDATLEGDARRVIVSPSGEGMPLVIWRTGQPNIPKCVTATPPFDALVESVLSGVKKIAPDIFEMTSPDGRDYRRIFADQAASRKQTAMTTEEIIRKAAIRVAAGTQDKVLKRELLTILKDSVEHCGDEGCASEEKESRHEEGKSVDIGDWLRDHGYEEAADKWEKHEGKIEEIGKSASAVVFPEIRDLAWRYVLEFSAAKPTSKLAAASTATKAAAAERMAKKWISDAIKRPGRVHEYLGIPEDQTIPMAKLDAAIEKVKATGNKSLLAALQLAKRLKGMKKAAAPDKAAAKWKTMPKGWTDESRKKFWESLTGRSPKHKVTACIKRMEGNVSDAGAFCAALADRVLGTTDWRGEDRTARANPFDNDRVRARIASTNPWISYAEMVDLCPSCAERMHNHGITRIHASVIRRLLGA